MAAYTDTDPFAWPFKNIQPEHINVEAKNYTTFLDFLLTKIQETKPSLIASPTVVLPPEISLEDSGPIETSYRTRPDDYAGEYSRGETTSLFNIEQSSEVTDRAFFYADKMVDNLMTAKQKVFTHPAPLLETVTTSIRTTLAESFQDPFAWPCKDIKPEHFHVNFKRPGHESTSQYSSLMQTIRTKPGYFAGELTKRMTETLSNGTTSSEVTDKPVASYLGKSLDNLMVTQRDNLATNSTGILSTTVTTTITSAWTEGVSLSNSTLRGSSLVSTQIRAPFGDWKNTTSAGTAQSNLTTLISLFKLEQDGPVGNVTVAGNKTRASETPLVFRNFQSKYLEGTEDATVARSLADGSTAVLGKDKITTMFGINYDEVATTGLNDEGRGYAASTMRYAQGVVGTRTNEEVLVYAMEESQDKGCYFYIVLIVVLVLLVVIAGVFLFYRVVKRNRGYGYKVSQMKDYHNAENDNDVINV